MRSSTLPKAHLLTREEQLTRDLLIQRVRLGQDVTKLKLRILSYLKREELVAVSVVVTFEEVFELEIIASKTA